MGDVGIIYSISGTEWMSPTRVVPKKTGIIIVKNFPGEMVLTRVLLVRGYALTTGD